MMLKHLFIVHFFILIPVMLAHSSPKEKNSAQKLFDFVENGGDVSKYTNKSLAEKLDVAPVSLRNVKNVFLASGVLSEDVSGRGKNPDEPVIVLRTKKILSKMSEKDNVFNMLDDVDDVRDSAGYLQVLNTLIAVGAVIKSGRWGYKINDENFRLVDKKLEQNKQGYEENISDFCVDYRLSSCVFDVGKIIDEMFN